MKRPLLIPLILFLLLGGKSYAILEEQMVGFSAPGIQENAEEYSNAESEAIHFLNLLAQEQYGAAWNDASPLLKDVAPNEIWSEGVRAMRGRLGQITSRQRVSHVNLSSIGEGMVAGNFYQITYRTQFWGGASRQEIVIVMQEVFGRWRVVSYTMQQ